MSKRSIIPNMKFKLTFDSITFYGSSQKNSTGLEELETVIKTYGPKPNQVDTDSLPHYRPRLLQHFCYNPFVWTSKCALNFDTANNSFSYRVHYPAPIIVFAVLFLFSLPYSDFGAPFVVFGFWARYLSCIFFMQADVFKRMLETKEENSYLSTAKRYMT